MLRDEASTHLVAAKVWETVFLSGAGAIITVGDVHADCLGLLDRHAVDRGIQRRFPNAGGQEWS